MSDDAIVGARMKVRAGAVQHRADAACLELSCDWRQLGKWCGSGGHAVALVANAARRHTATTGHETMVDTVTRRNYRHKRVT